MKYTWTIILTLFLLAFGRSVVAQPVGKFGGGNDDGYGSGMTSGALSTPLAVDQPYLGAEARDVDVLLEWQLEGAGNLERFLVERSHGSTGFESLGSVTPVTGRRSYSFVDLSPKTGLNHYRLRGTDLNGTTVFSALTKAVFEPHEILGIYPNPVGDRLTLSISAAPTGAREVSLYDAFGRQMQTFEVSPGPNEIDLSAYPAGVYTLQAGGQVVRIVKE